MPIKLGIMQPYYCPYIGYWQLINAVDDFVVYDNIKYTKRGWINRNRFLQNGKDALFTINLKKDSDFLDIKDRIISNAFDKKRIFRLFEASYKKAPYFEEAISFLESILFYDETNLFKYIYHSIKEICKFLNIETKLIISSEINIDHNLKSQDKVLAICQNLRAAVYINPIGGLELYSKETFNKQGIELKFIKSKPIEFIQFNNEFIPWLSIIDIMMFNSKEDISKLLNHYEIITIFDIEKK